MKTITMLRFWRQFWIIHHPSSLYLANIWCCLGATFIENWKILLKYKACFGLFHLFQVSMLILKICSVHNQKYKVSYCYLSLRNFWWFLCNEGKKKKKKMEELDLWPGWVESVTCKGKFCKILLILKAC